MSDIVPPQTDYASVAYDNAKLHVAGGTPAVPEARTLNVLQRRAYADGFARGLMETVESEDAFWKVMEDVATHFQIHMPRRYGNWLSGMFGKDGYCIGFAEGMAGMIDTTRAGASAAVPGALTASATTPSVHVPKPSDAHRSRLLQLTAEVRATGNTQYPGHPIMPEDPAITLMLRRREDQMQQRIQQLLETHGADPMLAGFAASADRELRMRRAIQTLVPEEAIIGNQRLVGVPPAFRKLDNVPASRELVYEIARYLVNVEGHRFTQISTMDYSAA